MIIDVLYWCKIERRWCQTTFLERGTLPTLHWLLNEHAVAGCWTEVSFRAIKARD